MNDAGKLSLMEDSATRFNLLAQAQVLKGRESWGPMALAGGRLLARDFTRLVCLDVCGALAIQIVLGSNSIRNAKAVCIRHPLFFMANVIEHVRHYWIRR